MSSGKFRVRISGAASKFHVMGGCVCVHASSHTDSSALAAAKTACPRDEPHLARAATARRQRPSLIMSKGQEDSYFCRQFVSYTLHEEIDNPGPATSIIPTPKAHTPSRAAPRPPWLTLHPGTRRIPSARTPPLELGDGQLSLHGAFQSSMVDVDNGG